MEGMMRTKKHASHWWWLDSNSSTKRSPWLQSTLSELEDKTEAMLKLIEGDADSFAQRAEMYYRKRPELMSMVEDFYRTHRLLAGRYDQLKSESGTRLLMSIGSPFSSNKSHLRKSVSETDQNYDSHSENFEPVSPFSCNKYRHEKLNYDSYSDTFEHDDNAESEVEDPEEEDRIMELKCHKNDTPARNEKRETPWQVVVNEEAEGEVKSRLSGVSDDEVKKLRDEIERLKEENRIQKDLLVQKDEEKREVMRQLSLSMGALKDGVSNDEAEMLREEIERLKEESMVQKGLLAQKDEEKREVVRQVSLSMEALKCGVSDDEAKKLSEEIEKLMEESKNQKDLLVQKDEEKREVIRQLSMSMGVLKDENLMLKKRIARDCKKRNPFEFDQKKSGFLNLFNRSSTQPNLGAAV